MCSSECLRGPEGAKEADLHPDPSPTRSKSTSVNCNNRPFLPLGITVLHILRVGYSMYSKSVLLSPKCFNTEKNC